MNSSDPSKTVEWIERGHRLCRNGRIAQAIAAYREAVAEDPAAVEAWNGLGVALQKAGRAGEAVEAYSRACAARPGHAGAQSNRLFAMLDLDADQMSPAAVAEAHREWARQHAAPLAAVGRPPYQNDRNPDRRLRVGYVSADFRYHASATFLEPVLAAHDREAADVVCFNDSPHGDEVTSRIRSMAGAWHETAKLSDVDLARLIFREQIDVLVDPTGHMARNRLLTFARCPAPVQVTYPGYPCTTGLVDAFDALITDEDRAPTGAEALFSEPLVRIAGGSQCYRPPPNAPDIAPSPPCEWNGFVTFACLNRLVKVTPRMMRLWGEILSCVPMSRLAVLVDWHDDPTTESEARERFAQASVPVDRLDFVPRMRPKDYLAFYNRVDILLDTHPYNGHTTTLDATRMGVPTVTLAGEAHVSREGLAVQKHVGLVHLSARSEEEYIAAAIRQASRRDELAILRRELRGRLAASPLCDGRRVATELERVYRDLWRRWCAGSVGASNT